MDISIDLSSKKSEMVFALIISAILGTKTVPVKLVQLKSLFSLGQSFNWSNFFQHS